MFRVELLLYAGLLVSRKRSLQFDVKIPLLIEAPLAVAREHGRLFFLNHCERRILALILLEDHAEVVMLVLGLAMQSAVLDNDPRSVNAAGLILLGVPFIFDDAAAGVKRPYR